MEQEIHQGAIEYLGGIQYLGKLFHQQGGAQWSINRELTLIGVGEAKLPTGENCLYGLYFSILSMKHIPRDSRDTRANHHRVKAQPWSINGQYSAL